MLLLPLPFRGSNPRVNNVPCMILLERGQELKVECFPGVLLGGMGGRERGRKRGRGKKKWEKREKGRGERGKKRERIREKRGKEIEGKRKKDGKREKEGKRQRKRGRGEKERRKGGKRKKKRERERERSRDKGREKKLVGLCTTFILRPLSFSLSFFLSFLRFFPFPGRDIWNQFCILTLKAGQLLLALKTRIHLVPFSPAPLVTQYYNILATF